MTFSITVYCSSSDRVDQSFFDLAKELGVLIAQNNYQLVYGGSAVGLMGALAQSVKDCQGTVIGVIPEKISNKVPHLKSYDELVVTKNMRERKSIMEEKADAFIALPGGFGTLEELIEVITLKQLQFHKKPIVLLNFNGCFDHLLAHFEYLFSHAFAKPQYRALYAVVETPAQALEYIEKYVPVTFDSKWYLTDSGFQEQEE
ncbi:MAG: TIGR00730 family Rossman fold protein [Promethearchaeota archaeon]